ncbi:hypothetical protein BdWA1_001736 [Babesia duncani]|uniref:Uncharacterized protein n=1 Tax=Babesia duncani TaxID=323732 RepID=A0AAD9PKN2_9APIC|nr:hypothetical protein BdWA1_001736 [Babesia duncani]
MQKPPIAPHSRENAPLKCLYALLPEQRHDHVAPQELRMLNFGSYALELSHLSRWTQGRLDPQVGTQMETQQNNLIVQVPGTFSLGSAPLDPDAKRANHLALIDLAIFLSACDGVIIPLDALELQRVGCGEMYSLALARAVFFLLDLCKVPKPRVHVLLYKWDEKDSPSDSKQGKAQEIHQLIAQHLAHDSANATSCTFSSSNDAAGGFQELAPILEERLEFKSKWSKQLKHLGPDPDTQEPLWALRDWTQRAPSEHLGALSGMKEIQNAMDHPQVTRRLHVLLETLPQRLEEFIESLGSMQAQSPHLISQRIHLIIKSTMEQYDTEIGGYAREFPALKRKLAQAREMLMESFRDLVGRLMMQVGSQIHEELYNEFRQSVSGLSLGPNLDGDLTDLVIKYDKLFCKRLSEYNIKGFDKDSFNRAREESMRVDFLDACNHLANYILEYAISKGYCYYKPSLEDSVGYISMHPWLRWIHYIYTRLKVPISLSIHYLSPSAFGFSNFFRYACTESLHFRNRWGLSGGVLSYFTTKTVNTFSNNPTIRGLASGLVESS